MDTKEREFYQKNLANDVIKVYSDQLFQMSSGYRSPIYCDNRVIMSLPSLRFDIKNSLANLVKEKFAKVDAIVSVETGAIAMGALIADRLNLPSVSIHPDAKLKGQQIDDLVVEHGKVVIYEDLISKGDSVSKVIIFLREKGYYVLGVVTTFDYGFEKTKLRYRRWGVPVYALTNLENLCIVAGDTEIWKPDFITLVKHFHKDPADWHNHFKI